MAMILMFCACEPQEVVTEVVVIQGENPNPPEEVPFKTEGFIVSSIVQSAAGFSYFVGFSEDQPVGNLDLTRFNSFEGYFPQTTYKNFAFGGPLNNQGQSLTKYAVDNETGQIVEAASIPLTSFLSQVLIIDDETGIYTIFDTPSLFVFNPATMQLIQEIPMPEAVQIEAFPDQTNSYFHIIYRAQDNKAFLPLTTNSDLTPPFYDATDVYVEVVDLNSRSWEKTAIFTGATYPLTRGMENPIVDEQGNIYITTQGQYSLDGQIGPTANPGSRPQLLKIPAGSTDFDSDYAFNPINTLGFSALVAQLMTGTIYGSNGIAYAAITASNDDPRILELLVKVGEGTITEQEFNELTNLVLNSPTFRWVRLDLNAQTVSVIEDIPFTAGFTYPFSYEYDGKFYFQVFDPTGNANGYYEYDPETGTSFNIYNVTAGGVATHFIRLQD